LRLRRLDPGLLRALALGVGGFSRYARLGELRGATNAPSHRGHAQATRPPTREGSAHAWQRQSV